MTRTKFIALIIGLALLLAACGPSGTPTPSVADLQATAMAAAQTQIAQTAAAMPTATQIPPTPIPPTPIPPTPAAAVQDVAAVQPTAVTTFPTLAPTSSSASTSSDPCAGPIAEIKGPHTDITITNSAKGPVDMYFYMYQTPFGCGYGSVSLESGDSETVSVPNGCYDFYGWVNGAKPSTPAGYACFNNNSPTKIKITPDAIQANY